MQVAFEAIAETSPGPKWQGLFARHWPAYREWFLNEGEAARATYLASLRALRAHVPELIPTYERLVDLAGGGDLAARLLSLYRPPPYLRGCSQAVWPAADGRRLVRNYDYHPALTEGSLLLTAWNGRRVMAMGDCLWGVLDGMNDRGLVVSLTFGGRREVGDGFGIPLVLRYVLEFCDNTAEAIGALRRIPAHMAYNVTVLDRFDRYRTVQLSPDRDPVVRRTPFATNHQGRVEWAEHARATSTLERERALRERLADARQTTPSFVDAFLRPPLHSTAYERGYGTLYTAVYHPREGRLELRWPGRTWVQGFDRFEEGSRRVRFAASPRDDVVEHYLHGE